MVAISPETLANVMKNTKKRARFCLTNKCDRCMGIQRGGGDKLCGFEF